MAMPEYTDGVLELYEIADDESEDYPEEKLKYTGLHIWYRELAVYDTTRAKLSADSIEVTYKIAIPQYKKINSKFATLLSVKDLEFQLESICTAMLLATDRRRASLLIS